MRRRFSRSFSSRRISLRGSFRRSSGGTCSPSSCNSGERKAIAALAARQRAKIEATDQLKWEQPLDPPPQADLLISRDGRPLTRVALGQRTLLGRSEHNDVRLPSPYLSRHHCVFVGT